MGGGLESRCVGRVYGADGAAHGTIRMSLMELCPGVPKNSVRDTK